MKNLPKAILVILLSASGLLACDKLNIQQGIACNDEITKNNVKELFQEKVEEFSKQSIKQIVQQGETVPLDNFNYLMSQLTIDINDVRTTSDEKTPKKQCEATLTVQVSEELINKVNAARYIEDEQEVAQQAILDSINLKNSVIEHNLLYSVQPTDDGEKIYTSLENAQNVLVFLGDLIVDGLRLPLLEQAQKEKLDQEKAEQKRIIAEQQELQKAKAQYDNILVREAKQRIDNANARINLVWQATTPEIRAEILPEQRLWLKKRELECKLVAKSENGTAQEQEVVRLNCEAEMTDERTEELREIIYQLENQ